jgi:coenzyme F420-reducing hydrogenase delta subunit
MSSWDSPGLVLAFICNWAPYRCFMDLVNSGRFLPPSMRLIKVPCAARVDVPMVLSAFEKGASGVLILECKDGECRYGPGPRQVLGTTQRIKEILHILGLGPLRFHVLELDAHESERLLEEVEAFAGRMDQLARESSEPAYEASDGRAQRA